MANNHAIQYPPEDLAGREEELETLTPIEEIPASKPSPVPRAADGAMPPTKRESFEFTGSASEYFRIWIVNVALTILTLGIYSAWAKVRNNRYFYGNTRLMGSTFEYHADPKKILKGRIVVFVFFAVYNIATQIKPMSAIAFSILFMFLVPWLAIKSMKFRARNSSYRNIRFNFDATYRRALSIFVGYGILSTITLGLGYPHFAFRRKEFAVEHSRFGTTPFRFSATSGGFYKIYIKAALLVVLLIATIIVFLTQTGVLATLLPQRQLGVSPVIIFLPIIIMAAFYLIVFAFLNTSVDNLSLSTSSIGSSRLESTMKVRDMAWIHISNAFLIVLTLGIMTPWAKVRSKRYKIEHLYLNKGEDFDTFIAEKQKEESSLGEEAVDFMDFDIGL